MKKRKWKKSKIKTVYVGPSFELLSTYEGKNHITLMLKPIKANFRGVTGCYHTLGGELNITIHRDRE